MATFWYSEIYLGDSWKENRMSSFVVFFVNLWFLRILHMSISYLYHLQFSLYHWQLLPCLSQIHTNFFNINSYYYVLTGLGKLSGTFLWRKLIIPPTPVIDDIDYWSSSSRDGDSWCCPHPCADCWPHSSPVWETTLLRFPVFSIPFMSRRCYLAVVDLVLVFQNFSVPSSVVSPELCYIKTNLCLVPNSMHFDQMWTSVINSIFFKKFLLWRERGVFNCRYNYLEYS